MGGEFLGDLDMEEVLPSMWPDDLANEDRKQFNIDKPGFEKDMLENVTITEDPTIVDFKRLVELTNYSEKGSSQLAYLVKNWEYKQANAVRLLNEELNILSKQRQEVERKKLDIIEEHRFVEEKYDEKHPVSILDEVYDIWDSPPKRRNDVLTYNQNIDIDAEFDTIKYWKQRAMQLDNMLEASIQREQTLIHKLEDSIKTLEKQSSPVEELSDILKRADNFLHFVLQNAPVVIGHQDKDLRYRFIYNPFPSLGEEEIIGKTDTEIFSGAGVKENQEFKREVMERGRPAKREITFETELFGSKTFLIYVEPVFNKAGDTIGVNYMGMEITDQVIKREKMAKVREEMAVQKAKETELNKTIHITEETMRAKQMLATMSHEIRSPLTGVVSMAEILANTKMDKEQHQLLDVMISSGDLVLQLINDILDLSKVESGVMKLESTKFRPREVVKHVLQTFAASLKKELTLEGHVAENVPVEVIGDVLRIRQILTNLISNAIKFTHKGKVGIKLHVVSEQYPQVLSGGNASYQSQRVIEENSSEDQICDNMETSSSPRCNGELEETSDEDSEKKARPHETRVWLRCDVYDTGIGIPEKALPSLFKKYMQASADHARKYGGTGLGLAICKQLVELMGGCLTVSSKQHCGSTFTFVLPYKIPSKREHSEDTDEDSSASSDEDISVEELNGTFLFKPHTLGTFTSDGSMNRKTKMLCRSSLKPFSSISGLSEESDSFSSNSCFPRETASADDFSPVSNGKNTCNDHDTHRTNTMKRREETLASNGFHMDSSTSPHSGSSEECATRCSEEANTSCSSIHRYEKGPNFPSLTNGSCQENTIRLKPKILLVEDNKINIMVAQSMMKQLGHSIDVANNGLEAIRAVQRSQYDIILMDVYMPVMDGLQATRFIRSYEQHGYWDASIGENGVCHAATCSDSKQRALDEGHHSKRIPIIAMTANSLSESAEDCLANGMDSFVSKPVTFQKLKQCLEQYLPR
ncbi:uncharacterized protein A4U43_C05F34540 [Asparagus officinalis]|uniref:histidine kinase n=1 Tax=Asparagus officinalis TaxID=4686 RepID=A0A5P1F161_ASPOF|nr:histidine kinase 5 [Asparagus officinalis]XP_020265833.1 histidine kinase 5 [Asparagus officinalis]ONK70519.1 uncharacterized protein A4U43_C05F34540 [Asparagus officinalis]